LSSHDDVRVDRCRQRASCDEADKSAGFEYRAGRCRTRYAKEDGGCQEEGRDLDDDMKAYVLRVFDELVEGQGETGGKEDESHGTVRDGVFRPNVAAMLSNAREEVGQEYHQSHGEE